MFYMLEAAAAGLGVAIGSWPLVEQDIERGRCMELAGKNGRMLAVGISEEEAGALIAGHAGQLCIGSINGPRSVVISGDAAPLESR